MAAIIVAIEAYLSLSTGQPLQANRPKGAVGPKLDILLDVEYASCIVGNMTINGMAAHVV